MGSLLARVLPLVLGAAVSPTALAAQVMVLSAPEVGRRRASALAVGFLAVLAALTALALTVLHAAARTPSTAGAVVDLVAAALLAVLAGVDVARRHDPPRPPKPVTDAGWWRFVGLGVVLMLTNFSTIVLYVPAMKEVARADADVAVKAVVTVVAFVVTSVPVTGPLLAAAMAPATADRLLGRLNGFLSRHRRMVGATICTVFAVYLLVKGVQAL
jgi:threonine/homoserine/homoserine lactone efflux protein